VIVILIVFLLAPGAEKYEVAHRFFIGDAASTRCSVWGGLLIERQDAENNASAAPEANRNIIGASCIETGIPSDKAPWIEDGTKGLTPGLPGQPSF
jgi:hypothetical protein